MGYKNTNDVLSKRVFFEDKMSGVAIYDSMGRTQCPVWINESGRYSLFLSSKLESAKRFKKWVTSELLPSIRKNGGCISGQENFSDEELMAKAVLVAQKKIEERDKEIRNFNQAI